MITLLERFVVSMERIAARFGADGEDAPLPTHPVQAPQRDLHEAMERYERDLPMTAEQVALLLDISERTVRRMLSPAGRSNMGGTGWYSRKQVEAIWRASENSKKRDFVAPHPTGKHIPSSSEALPKDGSLKPLSKVREGSARFSAAEIEKRLRDKPSRSSKSSGGESRSRKPSRLKLIRPPSSESEPT